jgi:hypothetical protein
MAQAFLLILTGVTSILALLVGAWWLRLPLSSLKRGAGKALECIGVMLGFFVLNLAVGIAGTLLWRQATGTFLSLYYANDATLLGISLLQGLVFVWWRESQAPIRRGREG